MQWLESFILFEASAAFVLASMNCRSLWAYARAARRPARRAGAGALCMVSGALSLEALVFLTTPALATVAEARELGVLLVRSALLLASAALAALLLRNGRRRV